MNGRIATAILALVLLAGCGSSGGGGDEGGGGTTTSAFAKTGRAFPNVLTFGPAKSSVRYPEGFKTIGNGGTADFSSTAELEKLAG